MHTITEEQETRYAELQLMALEAARQGDVETLQPLLAAGIPINLQDEKGNSLLMLASYHGHHEAVVLLLNHGADPDRRNDRGQTPLGGVAFKGYLEIARLLVDHGAAPSADQGGGQTPVMFAAVFGRKKMVAYLQGTTAKRGASAFLLKLVTNLASGVRRMVARPIPQTTGS